MDGLPVSVNVAIVGIGADEAAPKVIVEQLGELGHRFVHVQQIPSGEPLLPTLTAWVESADLDVVIVVTPDVGSVRDTLDPLVTRDLPGFAELFRIAAFGEIGSSAMVLDADAARCGNTFVFVLPNLVGAVKVALERLLIPQLDTRTRPISLASKFPRLRAMMDAPTTRRARTESGSGVHPIAPATPASIAPAAPVAVTAAPSAPVEAPTPVADTPSARARTVPPPPPQPAVPRTVTAPMGEILRTPAAALTEEPEMINSDAAILIPPAVIVEDQQPQDKQPEAPRAARTSDQVAAFAASLEAHAREVRKTQSQVGPLPRRTKTEPPPLPRKTDAELKAERDAQVTEAISKVEPLPKPAEEAPAPTPRKKNITSPAQWAQASTALAKMSSKPAEPTLAELQSRDRVIAVPKQKSNRRLVWVPIAIVLGAGGGLLLKSQFSGNRTASAADQPAPPPQQVAEVQPTPTPTTAPADQPAPLPPEAPIEVTVTVPVGSAAPAATPDLTSIAQGTHHHHTPAATPPAGSAAGSAGSDEAPDPRTHPNVAPASPDCDEASCILEKYARECCARYKPAEMPAEVVEKKPDGPPDTLDKNAVKAGIADVKPAVQQCGEEHYHQGTVKITLTVDASGRVTDATVAESPDPELGTCVAGALKRASFAKTQNGAVFTYPFMF
jgi:molybdenum cofactor biosynthesis protein B